MKVLLKIIKWVVVLLVVLLLLTLGGLYGFLKYGLTGTVQQHVLPEVLAQTGLDAELEHVDLDLFNGTFNLKGLRVKNPAGFVEPDLMTLDNAEVMVRLKSLLTQDPIEVQRIKLQGAKLHVIRNREKMINVMELQTELTAKMPPKPAQVEMPQAERVPDAPAPERVPEPPVADAPVPSMPLPAIMLKALEADLVVDYIDNSEQAPVEQGQVAVNVRGRNLSAATADGTPWGELYLMCEIQADGHGFPANFNLLIAPFHSPETLSFDLKGAPFEMDAELVNHSIKELGLESDKVRLEVNVKAREGVIVVPDSVIGTELKGVTLDKSVAGTELSASALKFFVPVSGTVLAPVVDWQAAIGNVVAENRKVLMKEVGNQLLDKAIKPEEKAGIQALGKALGFDLGLGSDNTTEEVKSTESVEKVEPEKQTEPEEEQTDEQKVLSGVLRVLEESKKEDGEPESTALEEVLKIFGK